MDILNLIFIAAANFVAAFVQASTGFGYALIAMSVMPLFLPMSVCSAISACCVVAIGLQMTGRLHKNLCLKTVWLPILFCLCTINLGLWLLNRFKEMVLRMVLAGLLLAVTIFFFVMRKKHISLPQKWYSAALTGLITGIATGMFNIVGPFMMIYYMSVSDDTLEIKANLEFTFLLAGLYSAFMHLFVYHNISLDTAPQIAVGVIGSLIAGVFGLKLYRKISVEKITLCVYIILPIMAAMLIWNGLH